MSSLTLQQPPQTLCIIRLSAIGDVTHMLPIIATLHRKWPDTRITWIIGAVEYQLVRSIPNVEFIVFNKRNGLSEYLTLRKQLRGRHFDMLLMMQVALRASLISLLVKSQIKIGYDKKRSRDFQHLFCDQFIDGPDRVHVLDTFFQFLQKIGINERHMDWLLTANTDERDFARSFINDKPTVIINPCSSVRKNNWRNWSIENYAKIINYLAENNIQVILTGGPDGEEVALSQTINDLCGNRAMNLVGKTTLTQLLALIEQSLCLIAPDTGPAHIGTIADKPVIGLYASSNPQRTGPYRSLDVVIDAYPDALRKYKSKTVEQAAWGERVRHPQVMQMIGTGRVIDTLSKLLPATD